MRCMSQGSPERERKRGTFSSLDTHSENKLRGTESKLNRVKTLEISGRKSFPMMGRWEWCGRHRSRGGRP